MCAKCNKRFDTLPKNQNKKIQIIAKWLKDYFRIINVNVSIYRYCCKKCYRILHKRYQDKTILQEILIDKKKIKKNQTFGEDYFRSMTDKQSLSRTGINKNQFMQLYKLIENSEWNIDIDLLDALGFYLIKLRTGNSVRKLVNLIPIGSYFTVLNGINNVRNILFEKFVPENLGFEAVTRGLVNLKYTTKLSREIFRPNEENIITIWDGTYVYIQKSSNYTFAKKSFSMHKHRYLLKMMMSVSTNGNL